MGIVDLRIEHIRQSKHWKERHERMKKLKSGPSPRPTPKPPIKPTFPSDPDPMDPELHDAAENGDVEGFLAALERFSVEQNQPFLSVINQSTPGGDTFVHVASALGHEELAGFIVHHFRHFLVVKNDNGDTPLHVAARAGHIGVVDVLVSFRSRDLFLDSNWDDCLVISDEEREALIYRRVEERVAVNADGNTPMHEAMLNDHEQIVKLLIRFNVEEAYHANKEGKSPLYMAVEARNVEFVATILRNVEFVATILRKTSDYRKVLDEQLAKGKSVLKAAIVGKDLEMLRELVQAKPMLIHIKDEDGQSPDEAAASIGFDEGLSFLLNNCKVDNVESPVVNGIDDFLEQTPDDDISRLLTAAVDLKIEHIRPSELWKGWHDRIEKLQEKPEIPKSSQHPKDQNLMDAELYAAAKNGDVDGFISILKKINEEKGIPLTTIFNQLSPLQNTYLHVAASFGNEDLAGFIVHHFLDMISKKNHKGDTPLHLAARAGHFGVVEILVEFRNEQIRKDHIWNIDLESNNTNESLTKKFKERVMVNDKGDTPLHEALINDHKVVAEFLIRENLEGAYYVNKEGKSPLYMAVEAGNINHVKSMLTAKASHIDQDFLAEFTKGMPIIHAAISGRNLEMLQEIAKMKPELIHAKDEDGHGPLHIAASVGFLEGIDYLLNETKMDPFERDEDGLLPIHIAAGKGRIDVLEKLLQHFPDAGEFLTEEGHNVLHVATKCGKDKIVRYVLKTPGLESLINEKDKDGNTPLHLATVHWHPKIVSSLTWDKRVNLKLANSEGLTALEAAEDYIEAMPSYRKRLTWMALKSAGAPKAHSRNAPITKSAKSGTYKPYNMEYSKDRVNTLLLVATLVATVTFAAGFTMPGGFNNSEPDQGMATLLDKHAFQIFVICNMIAMYSAVIIAVTLIWAQLGDLYLVINVLRLVIPLLGLSLTMMSLAFMVGVYLVVSKLAWLADVVLVLGVIALLCLLLLFIPLILPYSSNFVVSRHMTYYPFRLLMLATGSYDDDDQEVPSL